MVDEGRALVDLAVVVAMGADDDVREAVAVHVPAVATEKPKLGASLVASAVQAAVGESPVAEPW